MNYIKVERKFLLLLFLLSIIPLIGVSLLLKEYVLKDITLPSFENPLKKTTTETPPAAGLSLPIPQDNPHVVSNLIFYTFSGKVSTISSTAISIDSSLPEFPLNPQIVKIFEQPVDPKTSKSLPIDSIKTGDTILLMATYNVKTQEWLTSQIVIQK